MYYSKIDGNFQLFFDITNTDQSILVNGKEVHVWTVNDLQTALSMIEIGVDNIITDDPEFIQNVLRTWNDLTDTEKIALWLRNLILDVDPAMVADL